MSETKLPGPFPGPYEPKKQRQYKVKFGKPFEDIYEFAVHDAPLPTLTKTNGGGKWNDMVFRMYDFVSPSTSQVIRDGLNELKKMDDQNIEIKMYLLGPVGDVVSEFIVIGELHSVNYGQLNWESDEPLIVSLHFKIKQVTLNY